MENKTRLAVHLHIHYLDAWEKIKQSLGNLDGYEYDLFVTLTKEAPELMQDIRSYHPRTQIYVVENRGYDVGPFLYFLHRINLEDYDFILKIHTKNGGPGKKTKICRHPVSRKWWARLLMESLIGRPEQVKKNMDIFELQPKVGMIGSYHLIETRSYGQEQVKAAVQQALDEMGYRLKKLRFVAGTMFMVRSKLMAPLKEKYRLEDFELTDGTVRDGTLAHVLERLFGAVVLGQGYQVKGVAWTFAFEVASFFGVIAPYFFQMKVTKTNCLLIKIFKIPVFYRQLSEKS